MNKNNELGLVLCKYIGLTECGEDGPKRKVRLTPFTKGTFRATQPRALNDVLSETKCLAYFNEFSPADIKVTKKRLQQDNLNGEEPSDEYVMRDLKFSYNSPRYTPDIFPGLFDGKKVSKTDFEQSEFLNVITAVNSTLIDDVSRNYGVLSLAQDYLDPLMWCHYSESGRGICIEFDTEHSYFFQNKPLPVSYDPADRLQLSYFEGAIRINGIHIKRNSTAESQTAQLTEELTKYFDEQQIKNAILYTKNRQWAYENEKRITYSLGDCQLTKRNCEGFFINRAEAIYCAEIPFSAFKNVYLGYAITLEDREMVINAIRQNNQLSHVTVFDVYPCPTGILRTKKISLAADEKSKR